MVIYNLCVVERCKSLRICIFVYECVSSTYIWDTNYQKVSPLRPFSSDFYCNRTNVWCQNLRFSSIASSVECLHSFKLEFFNGQLFRLFWMCVWKIDQSFTIFFHTISNSPFLSLFHSNKKQKQRIKLEPGLNGLHSYLFAKKMMFFCWVLRISFAFGSIVSIYDNCTYASASQILFLSVL